jgi:hypothetical protein
VFLDKISRGSVKLAVVFRPLQEFAAIHHAKKLGPPDKEVVDSVLLAIPGRPGGVRNREFHVLERPENTL